MIDNKKNFNEFLKKNLNPEQRKAVKSKDGVFLVVAGAGSGKTRVITSRITNLIVNENVQPQTIVGLTFTNKAAKEMKDRIKTFLYNKKELPYLGTFHSYCLRILKANSDLLPKPFESILDSDDQQKLFNTLIKRNGLSKQVTAKKLSYNISQIKNNLLNRREDVINYLNSDHIIRDLYAAYEQEKEASKCLDFDDLLIEAAKLLESNKTFQKEFQSKIKHVLVDEYQDTNVVQHMLLKNMVLDPKKKFTADSLCVVGDEDQSIYSWRGATIQNIMNFKKDFPKTKTIKIEQNYRSVQPILDAANTVIKYNKNRNPKKLWSDKKATDRIKTINCASEYQEGDVIAQYLKTAEKKQSLNTIALLYRAHYQSRAIEEALIRNYIPYKIIGGIQFYERKEVKDILAYLRLIVNGFDRVSFFRIINCPTRGLGAKFEELFYEQWNIDIFSDFTVIAKKLLANKLITPLKRLSLQKFIDVFSKIKADDKPSEAIEKIIIETQYITHLKNSYDKNDAEARIDNVKELIRATQYLEENGTNSIAQFLDEVALMQESAHNLGKEEKKDSVTLMTLHAAKGLEFDTIIIVGMEDGLLPSSRSLFDDDGLEEERRLFYVGITRAKERLMLTMADYRYAFGQASYQMPSRFLREMPKHLLSEVDFTKATSSQIDVTFCRWLGINLLNTPKSNVMTFGPARKNITRKTRNTFQNKKPSLSSSSTAKLRNTQGVTGPGHSRKNKYDTSSSSNPGKAKWKEHQPVQHKIFGIGVIQKVEEKHRDKIHITAKFKAGIKKIDAKFLQKV